MQIGQVSSVALNECNGSSQMTLPAHTGEFSLGAAAFMHPEFVLSYCARAEKPIPLAQSSSIISNFDLVSQLNGTNVRVCPISCCTAPMLNSYRYLNPTLLQHTLRLYPAYKIIKLSERLRMLAYIHNRPIFQSS